MFLNSVSEADSEGLSLCSSWAVFLTGSHFPDWVFYNSSYVKTGFSKVLIFASCFKNTEKKANTYIFVAHRHSHAFLRIPMHHIGKEYANHVKCSSVHVFSVNFLLKYKLNYLSHMPLGLVLSTKIHSGICLCVYIVARSNSLYRIPFSRHIWMCPSYCWRVLVLIVIVEFV